MKKILKILRRKSGEDEPYYESFEYEYSDEGATAATALMEISRRSGLMWEHSCLQKKCGACAMVIDGKPVLACDTRLSDLRGETVTVEPLRKFPVVRDLLVDRTAMSERLKAMQVYPVAVKEPVSSTAAAKDRREIRREEREDETAFEASRCIQCGLCLEVCPNYYREGSFAGMAGMAPLARLLAKNEDPGNRKTYLRAVYEGCGKSLACRDVCPAGIDMDRLLSRSNKRALFGK